MNFEKLELDKNNQPRLEESKALENPEFVDQNVLLPPLVSPLFYVMVSPGL